MSIWIDPFLKILWERQPLQMKNWQDTANRTNEIKKGELTI